MQVTSDQMKIIDLKNMYMSVLMKQKMLPNFKVVHN